MTLILSLGCTGVDALKAKTSTPGGIPHLSFKFQWRKTSSVILQHLGGIALHMGFQETYYCGDTCAAQISSQPASLLHLQRSGGGVAAVALNNLFSKGPTCPKSGKLDCEIAF